MILFFVFIFTNPIITHFNLTVLTDSLCLSGVLIFISSLINLYKIQNKNKLFVLFLIIGFLLASLTRAERGPILFIITILCAIIFYFSKKINFKKFISIVIIIFLLIGFHLTISSLTHNKTSENYRELKLSFTIMQIILHRNMEDSYNYYSDEIKSVVSLKDAQKVDESPLYVEALGMKLLDENPNGSKIIWEMIFTTILYFPIQILYQWIEMFLSYIFALMTTMQGYYSANKNYTTIWTFSRMTMKTPVLSRIYWEFGFLLQTFLVVFSFVGIKEKIKLFKKEFKPILPLIIFCLCFIIIYSFIFSFSGYWEFHLRYALPTSTLFSCILFTINLNYFKKIKPIK